jgi:L,D-peptidoglycan transpeptidase YkuD (ErfK/YbiS/YcfS/YnhG family)
VLALAFAFALAADDADPFTLKSVGAEQAVVVVTDSWDATIGTLKKFERVGEKWMQVGAPIEIVVGENGLGWGLGLHPLGVGEPRKLEGDARAPAGVFALASAFGRGAPAVKTKMPWLKATDTLVCVDDPKSSRYNRIVDTAGDTPTDGGTSAYQTAEPLFREDDRYDVAILVDHNALGDGKRAVIPGRGSCVFLHVWKKKGRATNGCTAMARWDLEKILEWLEPEKHPVLVQLPKEEWVKRRLPWGLP